MKVFMCLCRRPLVVALVVGLLAFGAVAQAEPASPHQMEWVAQTATGNVVTGLGTNDLVLSAGGVEVTFDIIVSNWGNVSGAPQLGAVNAGLIGSGMLGLNAVPSNPTVDLETEAKTVCASDGDCASGLCGVFEALVCDVNQAGFIRSKVCSSTTSQHCLLPAHCPAGEFCIDNAMFCLAGTSASATVDLASPARDWEWIGAAGSGAVTDPGWPMYMGTLKFVVPGAAAGTYTLGFNPADDVSFFNDGNSLKITGLTLVPGTVSVQIGRCCYSLGDEANEGCADGVKDSVCTAQYSAPRIWEADSLCPASGGPACAECIDDNGCKDPTTYQTGNDNKCTDDYCANNVCYHDNLWDNSVSCCDPDEGIATGLTPIDDFDLCTDDTCIDGVADHNAGNADGTSCDDGLGCTVGDDCEAGVCEGNLITDQQCQDDGPCVDDAGGLLGDGCVDGWCACSEDTPLCVDIWGKVCEGTTLACQSDDDCDVNVACVGNAGNGVNLYPDGNCFDENGDVWAQVTMGAGSTTVTGAAVAVEYDPACLELIGAYGDAPFTNVLSGPIIDEVAGTIFYSATVPYDQGGNTVGAGTRGPAVILQLEFKKLAGCDECDICLFDVNPGYTILTSDTGNRVSTVSCGCSKPIRTAGDIDLVVPAGDDVNSDCALPTATIEWPTPSATDSCDIPADLDVYCEGASSFGTVAQATVNGYVDNGGEMLQGKYFFICDASNSCGKVARKVWTVNISDQHSIDVEVHLSPEMNPGLFSRAITFVAHADCDDDITVFCEVMDFGPPANFRAHARTSLKVDKGNYLCITAQDELHTLRAAADIECIDNKWVAVFKGDPRLSGGNWLVGGNLDAAKDGINYSDANSINIVDFGVFMSEVAGGAAYNAPGNTDCDTDWPHGDINADGAVDSVDYSFILGNYLMTSKGACCPAPLGQVIVPTQEISVKELRRQGLGRLAVGDLNGDGVLNADDMAAYMQGVLPSYSDLNRGKQGSRR